MGSSVSTTLLLNVISFLLLLPTVVDLLAPQGQHVTLNGTSNEKNSTNSELVTLFQFTSFTNPMDSLKNSDHIWRDSSISPKDGIKLQPESKFVNEKMENKVHLVGTTSDNVTSPGNNIKEKEKFISTSIPNHIDSTFNSISSSENPYFTSLKENILRGKEISLGKSITTVSTMSTKNSTSTSSLITISTNNDHYDTYSRRSLTNENVKVRSHSERKSSDKALKIKRISSWETMDEEIVATTPETMSSIMDMEKEDRKRSIEPPMPRTLLVSHKIIGPHFETNHTSRRVVVKAGQNVLLDCPVALRQGRMVSWLKRQRDNLQLLTVGNQTYTSDSERVGLRFKYPNNWRLGIDRIIKSDEGEYQCQLSTHPLQILVFHLKVIVPNVIILDEKGKAISERHYRVGSSMHLKCMTSHVDKMYEKIVWQKGRRSLPAGDSRIKIKHWENQAKGAATSFLSIVSVDKIDSGNYTCRASSTASSTIVVHVLNGELPAAVQHESSGNMLKCGRISITLWVVLILSKLVTSSGQQNEEL